MRRRVCFLAVLTLWSAILGPPAFAADGAVRNFDLPAGEAGETLKLFARQSDREIVFPAETVKGVATRAVRGKFTVGDALGRMIAGTGLTANEDEVTGALAVVRREDRITVLPPFFVVEDRTDLHWRHATMPGFEILSCCPDIETQEFIEEVYRQQAWLNEIVPPDLQARTIVPVTLILLSDGQQKAMSRNLAALTKTKMADLIPQIRLQDNDSTGVDIVLKWRDPSGYDDIGLKSDYVFSLLNRRAPPLPAWFREGIFDFYQNLFSPPANAVVPPAIADAWTAAPFWIFPEKIGAAMAVPELQHALLAMPQLLAEPRRPKSPAGDGEADLVWKAQSSLFVRWAFDDETYARRRALWEFAARSSAAPATEAMFQSCFGMGFEAVRGQLRDYLPAARSDGFIWSSVVFPEMARLDLRDATETERARILGDWERKEIDFVKDSHPEFAGEYIRQANRTLMGAYDRGLRDPGLLAALGLYECAVRNDVRARNFLEEAVRGGVVRPQAYVELARIRLAAALARPAGAAGRLDSAQAASVLDLLRAIHGQPPPQPAAYLLTALVWEHAAAAPSPADLAVLDEGRVLFPADFRLALATARVEAESRR